MAPTDHRHNFLAGSSFFFTVDLVKRHLTRSKAMGFAKCSIHPTRSIGRKPAYADFDKKSDTP
jgi:hypothetical protein